MRSFLSILFLVITDIACMALSITIAVSIRQIFNYFGDLPIIDYNYIKFFSVYLVEFLMLAYLGTYTYRYDFWHESHLIVRSSVFSAILLFAGLALGQNAEFYSRSTLFLIFFSMCFFLPLGRALAKFYLFKTKIWLKKVKVIGTLSIQEYQIFNSFYTGYTLVDDENYDVLFISSKDFSLTDLNKIIENNTIKNREILFIPVLNQYDFTQVILYQNFDARVNLFALENKLISKKNKLMKSILDYSLSLLSLPIWGLVILLIALKMKIEEPKGKIFFLQERLGKDGKIFYCYKFRTMVSDQSFMSQWLIDNPKEKEYYETYHKYINDPRITKLGSFLRKTSLDELPQLFNVLKGDMSLVGNRPYMVSEKTKMGNSANLILASKPGITGLWQVSGRSDVSFDERLNIDSWYIKNWSLWNDLVILLKTIGVVLKRKGAS